MDKNLKRILETLSNEISKLYRSCTELAKRINSTLEIIKLTNNRVEALEKRVAELEKAQEKNK